MIENHRTQRVWKLFMQNAEVQRGLQRAGFVTLPFVALTIQAPSAQNAAFGLSWAAVAGRTYQVEYSSDLNAWLAAPGGEVTATGPTAGWTDSSPPNPPVTAQRFYRIVQYGSP